MEPAALWRFLVPGYLVTVAIETPVLLAGLSRPHPLSRRLAAGLWLSACTYPIVVLVLPVLLPGRALYLLVAEIFAPVAECALFWFAFIRHRPFDRRANLRDFATIVLANLCSFGMGELLRVTGGYDRLIEDPADLYLTFDNKQVGKLEAQAIMKAKPSGTYAVKGVILRPATSQDRSRVAAERNVHAADQLEGEGTREALEAQLGRYLDAVGQWRIWEVTTPSS